MSDGDDYLSEKRTEASDCSEDESENNPTMRQRFESDPEE